jgi:iron complex outermembrane recepter protein
VLQVKKMLLAASSLVAAAAGPAWAQDVASPDTIETIVVTGIRGSMEKSAAIKRDSKQVVDVITAEDVGKLPDNNVIEALARVTGVQITRSHGEGDGLSIRGMGDVGTTLNGNAASSGESRAMDLSSIPAELLKSVTVYKTRSADQVEGGIAGVVNVDLRRPLDLPEGWTIAGSLRAVNASIGDTWSPYSSLLLTDRFQTGIGEMGFLLNMSYTQNSYNENYFTNETLAPVSYYWNANDGSQSNYAWSHLSSSQQALNDGYGPMSPYKIYYGMEQGVNTRPSLNFSTQWRANDDLDFVFEGTYFSSRNKLHRDRLVALTGLDTAYQISDVTMMDNTGNYDIAKSYNYTSVGVASPNGPDSYYEVYNEDNFNTNFEMHWHHGNWQVNGGAQYNWSGYKYHGIYTVFRFNDSNSGSFDFASDKADGNAYVTYDNVDLNDVSDYDLYQYHDERLVSHSQEVNGNLDATYTVGNDWFLRDVKVGTRYTDRHQTRNYGYRDAWFWPDSSSSWVNKGMPLSGSSFPCANATEKVNMDMTSAPTWYRLSSKCLTDNEADIRSFILARNSAGTGYTNTSRYDWSTAEPSNVDLSESYLSHEYTFAGYALANWAANLYFPVDGQVGARVVNTWGDSTSTQYLYDTSWNETVSAETSKQDYTDVLPNGNATIHFTDKLQMRLSYHYQIQRPEFYLMRATQTILTASQTIYAGNPDLKPMREHNYDATLEYFFGKAGQLSVGYFLKKPHGWLYYDSQTITSGDYTGYKKYMYRNANPGTFEGFEFTAQSFFDFLPGFWSNFGAKANATLMTSYKIEYPYSQEERAALSAAGDIYAAEGTSRYTYNLELYYDTPEFSTRLSYNFRDRYRTSIFTNYPGLSPWMDPTSRLDMAVNYTPYKWLTLSVEGANLLEEKDTSYWSKSKYLKASDRLAARTIQFSARFRFD